MELLLALIAFVVMVWLDYGGEKRKATEAQARYRQQHEREYAAHLAREARMQQIDSERAHKLKQARGRGE